MTTGNRVADGLDDYLNRPDNEERLLVWPRYEMTTAEIEQRNGDNYIKLVTIDGMPPDLVLDEDLNDYLDRGEDVLNLRIKLIDWE